MGYTKTIELSIDSDDVAKYISDIVADCIDDAIRNDYLARKGYSDETIDYIMADGDFWNNVIKDLISHLTT